jgi:hypothetical protein
MSAFRRRLAVHVVGLAWMAAIPGIVQAAPPPNDDSPNATVISALPYSVTADVTEATGSGDDLTRCGALSFTVWYSFTPSTALRVEASALGNDGSYTALVAYRGVTDRTGEVGCGTTGPLGAARVAFDASPGVKYYFVIGSVPFSPGGVPARIDFSVRTASPPPPPPPAPDHDEIEDARTIGAIPFSDTTDTSDATAAADDPYCYGQGPTVWYSFTPTADTRVELNTFGSSYAATLSVYTGARGSLAQLACNAFSPGPGARVRFLAQANVTYHVMVGSYFTTTGGTLVLSAIPAPPPFTFDLQVDPRGTVEPSTGSATIRGTATCSQPAFVYLSGALRQERPGGAIDAVAFAAFFCDGTTAWSTPVFYSPRLFRGRSVALFVGGKASTSLAATAFSASEGEARSVFIASDVILTGAQPK